MALFFRFHGSHGSSRDGALLERTPLKVLPPLFTSTRLLAYVSQPDLLTVCTNPFAAACNLHAACNPPVLKL